MKSKPNEFEPITFGPGMPPPDPGSIARQQAQLARRAAIAQRARVEARSIVQGLQEAARTAGVVLGVLRVVEIYPAPWWLILLLLATPFLTNMAVLAIAWSLTKQ